MRWLLMVVAVAGMRAGAAVPQASSDGVSFPAPDTRKVEVELPAIHDKLGCLPGEMGRVFNSVKSANVLSKHVAVPLDCEWFVLGFHGADVAGFDLENGRVNRIVLAWQHPAPGPANAIVKQLSKVKGGEVSRHQTVRPTTKGGGEIPVIVDITEPRIMFAVDPVEWYVLYNTVPPKIADAMRSRVPIEGMTIDQARRCFGKPEEQSVQGPEVRYVWNEWADVLTHITSNDPGEASRQMQQAIFNNAAGSQAKHNTRRIEILFNNGKAVMINDAHFK